MIKIILERNDNIHLIKNQSQDDYARNLFNKILNISIGRNSSDIHIEPSYGELIIRIRVDGELVNILTLSMDIYPLISRFIKLSSGVNITEKRIPQDGRMDVKVDESNVDIRVSTVPTTYGEKLVLRLLNRHSFLKDKSELGFSEIAIEKINNIVARKAGILLVTGPTGSGKTTTVYSILSDLNKSSQNIMTIEDPVEYKMKGINQIQVSNKLGLTFEIGLRAILRQDPDIIMVGEIRDSETARVAIRAATTGHLVISTMHTNNAISTIERLMEMDIPRYLISSSIIGIISQKLIKKTCQCYDNDTILKECNECQGTGYVGRTVTYEVLEIDDEIKDCIDENKNTREIRDIAIKNGMITFEDSLELSIINKTEKLDNCMVANNN